MTRSFNWIDDQIKFQNQCSELSDSPDPSSFLPFKWLVVQGRHLLYSIYWLPHHHVPSVLSRTHLPTYPEEEQGVNTGRLQCSGLASLRLQLKTWNETGGEYCWTQQTMNLSRNWVVQHFPGSQCRPTADKTLKSYTEYQHLLEEVHCTKGTHARVWVQKERVAYDLWDR